MISQLRKACTNENSLESGLITCKRPSYLSWAEDFIFAGSSAVILLFANLFQPHWYLSFLALVPFIYRISRASVLSSIRLGFLFGLSFFAISAVDSLLVSPAGAALKILAGIAILTLFAGSAGWVRKCFGFNPLFVALLWAGFEYGLVKVGFIEGLFGEGKFSLPVFGAISAIFGFIIVSFIVVLANSLLVLAIEKVVSLIKDADATIHLGGMIVKLQLPCKVAVENFYLIPESRGPPL